MSTLTNARRNRIVALWNLGIDTSVQPARAAEEQSKVLLFTAPKRDRFRSARIFGHALGTGRADNVVHAPFTPLRTANFEYEALAA